MWECVESERIHSSHVETPRDGEKSPFRCLKSACLSYSTELKEKSDDDDLEFIFIRRRDRYSNEDNNEFEMWNFAASSHRLDSLEQRRNSFIEIFRLDLFGLEEAARTLNLNPKNCVVQSRRGETYSLHKKCSRVAVAMARHRTLIKLLSCCPQVPQRWEIMIPKTRPSFDDDGKSVFSQKDSKKWASVKLSVWCSQSSWVESRPACNVVRA